MASSGSIGDIVSTYLTQNQANSMDSLALISKKLVERMKSEKKDDAVNYTRPDLVRANSEKARLVNYKAKIADELSAVTKAKGAIDWTTSKLNTMLAKAQALLGSTDPAERAAVAAEFNEARDFINSKVDGAGQKIDYRKINLIGGGTPPEFGASNLYIHTSDKGGRTMIEGAYMGADYNIQDADGDLWRFSQGDNAYIEYMNDGTGRTTGASVSATGLTLDSFDHDTGAVTFGGSGSLSGTVVKGGIGVLNADFYGNFADDTGVQNAIDDVLAAMDYVKSNGASIKAKASLLQNSSRIVLAKVSDLGKEISKITAEEVDAAAAKSKAANLKMSLAVNNINLMSQNSTGLIQNLLDMTTGLGPAPGVFGQLGY